MDKLDFSHRKPIAIATENKTNKTIAIVPDNKIDLLLQDYSSLICEQYRAWYCRWIKRNGTEGFVRYAAEAKQEGRNPSRYFSWLLKNNDNGTSR